MADLGEYADRLRQVGDGNPVQAVGTQFARHQIMLGADGYLVRIRMDGQHIQRVGAG